jgi:hypothetical protein
MILFLLLHVRADVSSTWVRLPIIIIVHVVVGFVTGFHIWRASVGIMSTHAARVLHLVLVSPRHACVSLSREEVSALVCERRTPP